MCGGYGSACGCLQWVQKPGELCEFCNLFLNGCHCSCPGCDSGGIESEDYWHMPPSPSPEGLSPVGNVSAASAKPCGDGGGAQADDLHHHKDYLHPITRAVQLTLAFAIGMMGAAARGTISITKAAVEIARRIGMWRCVILITLMLLHAALATDDTSSSSSKPPPFDGTRSSFTPWLMSFSGWVAYRLTDSTEILDETSPEPLAADAPDGNADPDGHRDFMTKLAEWVKANKRLYGAILQAVPDYLKTSLYNDHRNNGLSAMAFLRASFDAVDSNDHAAHMARL